MTESEKAEQFAHWQDVMKRIAEKQDQNAFTELFDHFAPRLKAFNLAALNNDEQVAEDLVQEVMIKVWNKAHLYKPESAAVSTWIFTMARNCRIDYQRKYKPGIGNIDPEPIFETLEDEGPDPFQAMQLLKTENKVRESLAQLPFEQAQIVSKTYLEGKTHKETAEEFNLPLGTVKSRLRLALSKLEIVLRTEQ